MRNRPARCVLIICATLLGSLLTVNEAKAFTIPKETIVVYSDVSKGTYAWKFLAELVKDLRDVLASDYDVQFENTSPLSNQVHASNLQRAVYVKGTEFSLENGQTMVIMMVDFIQRSNRCYSGDDVDGPNESWVYLGFTMRYFTSDALLSAVVPVRRSVTNWLRD